MNLQPFSDHQRGLFVSIDGPSAAGKSTIVEHLAHLLVAAGEEVHLTTEPSTGPIGTLCRELTETTTGHPLACLPAADRDHHLEAEVRPNTEAGRVVVSDRYIPSGLVMQRFDGVDPAFSGTSTPRLIGPTWPSSWKPTPRSSRNGFTSAGRITASSSALAAATPRRTSTGRPPSG